MLLQNRVEVVLSLGCGGRVKEDTEALFLGFRTIGLINRLLGGILGMLSRED
jgi:hypothetical protein